MDQKQFQAIMPYIVDNLVEMIARKQNMKDSDAVSALYKSKLYALLEQEDTKVWYYSTEMLYLLWQQEQENGYIDFPDV